jgi:hypothetical protein
VGPAREWDEVVIRGDLEGGEFSAWFLEQGRLRGALAVGRSDDLVPARALLESGADLSHSRDLLADAGADLAALGG